MKNTFRDIGTFTYPETPMSHLLSPMRYDECIIDGVTYAILSTITYRIKKGSIVLCLIRAGQKNTIPENQLAGIQELVLLRKEGYLEFPISALGFPKIFCPCGNQLFPTLQWSKNGFKVELVLKPKIDPEAWILVKK